MKTILATISLVALCAACNTKPESKKEDKNQPQNNTQKNDSHTRLSFDGPIQVDSTAYVMIPLSIGHDDGRDGSDRFIFKSTGGGSYYWNIIFLNTRDQRYHLLDSGRKMLIKAYDRDGTPIEITQDNHLQAKYLFYEVITKDANEDGKLDEKDPTYLFLSDEEGNNFRQISPDNYDVRTWNVIKQTGKVLIYTVKADDKGRDTENKEIAPFIYDLKTGGVAGPMFSDTFVKGLKKTFDKQWIKK